jgi:hypothetical protein
MKKILTLVWLLCVLISSTSGATDDFIIGVSSLKGERSKDSHSTTMTIILKGGQLYYSEAFGGRRPPNKQDVYKDFKLTDDELQKLRELAGQLKLPDSTTNQYEKDFGSTGGRNYFFLMLKVKLNGKETLIKLKGNPQEAGIKEDELYQTSDTFIKEIFRILHAQDESIRYHGISE